jgi:hypothetical protein
VFKDGEMVFTSKLNLMIKLRMVEEGEIAAAYVNPTINDTGTWNLSRKNSPRLSAATP